MSSSHRARLGEIADRAPIHRTLHGEVLVGTTGAGRDEAALGPCRYLSLRLVDLGVA